MTDNDAWVDKQLRTKRVTAVADDGFTDSVVARLPPRRSDARLWIVPAATTVGTLLAVTVSANSGLLSLSPSLIAAGHIGPLWLLPLCLIWMGCAWVWSESR